MTTMRELGPAGGVMLRRELLAQGYDDRAIRAMVRAGTWHRVRHGAYIPRDTWQDLTPEDQHRVRCRAVLATAHRTTVLSHVSAVVEAGGKVSGHTLEQVHTSRTDGRRGRRETGVVHHGGQLPEDHVVLHDGVRITVPARSAIEMSTLVDTEHALVTINWFLGQGHVTREALEEMAVRARHWPGSLRTTLAVTLADGRNMWPGEARFSYLAFRHRLPMPEPQVEIHDDHGRLLGIVDFAWRAHGVFLEFDGRIKYERLREPGETLEQFLMREKRREELICRQTGWVCIRITWADLAKPEHLAWRINALLHAPSRRPA